MTDGTESTGAAPEAAPAAPAAPATAIAPDGVFVEGVGLVPHPDLPATKGVLSELEAMLSAAEKAADAPLHGILSGVHLLAAELKAHVARAKDKLEGDAAALVGKLHDLL